MATSSFTSHLLAISSCDRLPSSYRRFSYCLSSLLGVLTSAKVFASASHSLAACASPFLVTLQIIYSIPRFQPLETNPFLKTSPPSKVVGFIRPYFSRGRGEVSTLNRAKSIKTKASARYVVSRCGLVVRRLAGKQKDLGSIRFGSPFSSLQKLWFTDTVL